MAIGRRQTVVPFPRRDWKRVAPGIRQRADGRYVAYVRVGSQLRFHRFPSGTSLADVKAWRDETRVGLRHTHPSTRGTLAGDVATYLETLKDRPRLHDEREHQLAWWIERFGHRRRDTLEPVGIQAALSDFVASGAEPATANKYRTALLRLYATLAPDEPNPVVRVRPLRPPQQLPRGLPYKVVRQILDAMSDEGYAPTGLSRVQGSKAKARLRVIAWTGVRHSELKGLQPQDWDRRRHTLLVRTGKGGRVRTLPLCREAETALKELDTLAAWGPFSNSTVHRAFRAALEKLNLTGIRPYDLRHSFGTALYEASGDLRIVKEALGHTQTVTTERYTLGYVPTFMRRAVQRFGQMTRTRVRRPVRRSGR